MSTLISTTVITKNGGSRKLPFEEARLNRYIDEIAKDFPKLEFDEYKEKIARTISSRETYSAEQITNLLVMRALENITMNTPDWTFFAARLHLKKIYKEASKNRAYDASQKYGSFFGLLKTLASKGIYNPVLLRDYTKEEIMELSKVIDPDRDNLFTYIGLRTLADRYLATDHLRNVYELPQERFLIIAMTLMIKEDKSKRLELVKEAYWALSNLYMTVATPTLSNAGKSYGQLSSCFIDTIDDSLRGIYDSNTDIANLSKNGGGIKLVSAL